MSILHVHVHVRSKKSEQAKDSVGKDVYVLAALSKLPCMCYVVLKPVSKVL